MFCYTAGTEEPGTRKTTNDWKQTATRTPVEKQTNTTIEPETESVAEILQPRQLGQ